MALGLKMDFELIPAIDLKGGKCVRLQEGIAERATEYSDDPVAVALRWQDQAATRLHLVDLDGAFTGTAAHLDVARAIFRPLKIPVQFGGGIRSLEQVDRVLSLGAGRVILGTAAVEDPDVVEQAAKKYADAIIVGIDARAGKVASRGWVEKTSVSAIDLAATMRSRGILRVIYTDVSRDGMLSGINVRETEDIARRSGIRIIASGGMAGFDDIRHLWQRRASGIEGVILGRALYDGKLDLCEAIQKLKELYAGQENHSLP